MTHHARPVDLGQDGGLRARNGRLSAQVAELNQAIEQLAEPTGHRLVQALAAWVRIAELPGHPGAAQARLMLQSYARTHQRAMAVAAGLVLPADSGRSGG